MTDELSTHCHRKELEEVSNSVIKEKGWSLSIESVLTLEATVNSRVPGISEASRCFGLKL